MRAHPALDLGIGLAILGSHHLGEFHSFFEQDVVWIGRVNHFQISGLLAPYFPARQQHVAQSINIRKKLNYPVHERSKCEFKINRGETKPAFVLSHESEIQSGGQDGPSPEWRA